MSLLDRHVELRLASLRKHERFVPSDRAVAHLREALAPLHAGFVGALEDRGRVVGVLAWYHQEAPWFGAPVSSVAIDYEHAHPRIEEWLGLCLAEQLPTMTADLDLLVDVSQHQAYRALRRHGVGVDAVILLGDPKRAREGLRAEPIRPWPVGVEMVPCELEHVEPLRELRRRTFEASPQFCWFGHHERFLDGQDEKLCRAIEEARPGFFAILENGRFRGAASAAIDGDAPLFGPTAGMDLILDRRLRGRGLLRRVYDVLLDSMIDGGARTFKGGTSQPPVLKLAPLMGRSARAFSMRRNWAFDEAHFAPYLRPRP